MMGSGAAIFAATGGLGFRGQGGVLIGRTWGRAEFSEGGDTKDGRRVLFCRHIRQVVPLLLMEGIN